MYWLNLFIDIRYDNETVSYVFCISSNIAGLSDVLSQDENMLPPDPQKTGWLSIYTSLELVSDLFINDL